VWYPSATCRKNNTISLAEGNSQPNKAGSGNNCSIVKIVFVERTNVVLSAVIAATLYVFFSLYHLQTLNIGGTLVTKCEFWRNSCAGNLYFWVKGWIETLKLKILLKITYLCVFVRNKILLLAIYTENKTRIGYVPKWGKTNLKSQITKIIFRNFIIEEIFLRNPKSDGIPAFSRTEFEWHCFVPSWRKRTKYFPNV
jgi:hypothetical protein